MPLTTLRRAAPALAFLASLAAGPALAQNAPNAQNNPGFNLVNRSGQTIQELYVSSSNVNSWGQDLLGNDVLVTGRTFPVRLRSGQCTNDIRVVYAGGRDEERRNVNTCQTNEVVFGQGASGGQANQGGKGGAAAAGRSGNPSFNLVNRTNRTIEIVRASPSSDSSWGEDRLGNDMVAPGARFAIRLPAGECSYDIRLEYQNQVAEERRNVDLCNVSDVTAPLLGNN